jgi:hypothetical protein
LIQHLSCAGLLDVNCSKALAAHGFRRIFTGAGALQEIASWLSTSTASRKSVTEPSFAEFAFPVCTTSGHPLVDGLHSIENKSDKVALF